MMFIQTLNKTILALGAGIAALGLAGHAVADDRRDYIQVVGSSTIYPFASAVAERLGATGKFKAPKVESTGTGGGIKKFCHGVGAQYPDIVNASRPMKKTELETCQKFGVSDITEVKIGYDGIVLATADKGKPMKLTRREIFLALAQSVPDPDWPSWDKQVDNPYKTWSQINPALPNVAIKIWGPPKTSGTRDAFAEMALEEGCQTVDWIKVLKSRDEEEFKHLCRTLRSDGVYNETGEDDNLIVQKLQADPSAVGIVGYNFLAQNAGTITPVLVDGVKPDYASIYSAKYPLSRPLYVYVKKAHIGLIPGVREYVAEFGSDQAAGSQGYLIKKGLIPLTAEDRQQEADKLLTND
ncbi:PstS family phosphate ABC transporter substrate-binding protein [Methylomagnum sp.]